MEMEKSILEKISSNPELLFWAFFGAFILYILNSCQDHQPFSLFTALNKGVSINGGTVTIFFDMLISSFLGAILVFVMIAPETGRQALAAGLGMTGLLSGFGGSEANGKKAKG